MPVAALEPIAPAVPSAHTIPLDALPAGPFAPDLAPPVGPVVTPNQFAADSNGHHFIAPTNPNASPFPVCPDPALLASHLDAGQFTPPASAAVGIPDLQAQPFHPYLTPVAVFPGQQAAVPPRRRSAVHRYSCPLWSEHLLNKHKSNKLGYKLYTNLSSKFHV